MNGFRMMLLISGSAYSPGCRPVSLLLVFDVICSLFVFSCKGHIVCAELVKNYGLWLGLVGLGFRVII